MAGEPLSAQARGFIATHVNSIRRLELLLLLRDRAGAGCTADGAAAELRTGAAWAGAELEALRALALLDADAADQPTYRYAPSRADDAAMAELAEAYRRRKPTVVQAVLSAMGNDVQALADAFRVKRPDG